MFKGGNSFIMAFSVAVLFWSTGTAESQENAKGASETKVKWYTIEEAEALSKKAPRKFFIDLYTQWCGWCRKMDANTFSNPVIADYLNKKYYAVKFDAEFRDTVFFKSKAYTFVGTGFRGYNQLAYDLADGRLSYPTIIFLDEQANTIQAIAGYRDAAELDQILKYFGEDFYRKTDYQTFLTHNYKSPFTQPAGRGGQ